MSCRVLIAALLTAFMASPALAQQKQPVSSKSASGAAKSGSAAAVGDGKASSSARVLIFPENVTIGSLYRLDAKTDWTQDKHAIGDYIGKARGKVVVPPSWDINLNGNYQLMQEPKYLATLKPNDIQLLTLSGMEGNDKDFPYIAKMTGLKRLNLDGFVSTDDDVSQLKNLTNLETLSVWNTGIEGTCFKDLSGLKKLRLLFVGNNVLVQEAFKYIAKLTALEELNAVSVPINDVGIAYLAKMPNLKKLRIPNAQSVTGKGLVSLKTAPKLEYLQLENTLLSVDDLVALKGMKLKSIMLPKHSYSPKEMARLKAALPKTSLDYGGTPLDPETKVIFGPLH